MSDTPGQPKPKWPLLIAIISFLYAAFLLLFYRPSATSTYVNIIWTYAIIASMFSGALGLSFHNSRAAKVLILGSWLSVIQGAHKLTIVICFLGGIPTIFGMLGILTVMIPLHGWPVFLLFWLYRHKLPDTT